MQSIMRLLWIPHDSIKPTFALVAFDLVTADANVDVDVDVDVDVGPKSDSRRASLVNAPNRNLQNCSETLWKKKLYHPSHAG